jgi:putative lipoprotein
VEKQASGYADSSIGRNTAMTTLITDDERTRLLANGQARAARQDTDPLPVVRLFTPDAHVTWLLAALDPADGDTAHGPIDLGLGMPALGTVKLSDLASIAGPRKQPVMRDRYFQPMRRLSEYLRLSEEDGSIPD